MISGKVRRKSNHIQNDPHLRLLKFAAIFGANASGKSSLVSSLQFGQILIYDQVLERCREKKISLHLSNPCFEFRLLLHFPVVPALDPPELLANKKITRTMRFLELELKKIDPSFQTNHLQFEMYEEHIDTAIENEARFCEDIAALKTELGRNIGKLLSEPKYASEIPV